MKTNKIEIINNNIDHAKSENYEVKVDLNKKHSYFQNIKNGDESDSGGLYFENNTLVDYDGVFELPVEVIEIVKVMGFTVDL